MTNLFIESNMNKLSIESLKNIIDFLNSKSKINFITTNNNHMYFLKSNLHLTKKYILEKIISMYIFSRILVNKFIHDRHAIKIGLFKNKIKLSEIKIFFQYTDYINDYGVPNHIGIILAKKPNHDNSPNQRTIRTTYTNQRLLTDIIYKYIRLGFLPLGNIRYSKNIEINNRSWTRP